MSQESKLEDAFYDLWKIGRPDPSWPLPDRQAEFAKHLSREDGKPIGYAFDFAWPQEGVKVAIEIQGGQWSQGRHNRGAGMQADCEKRNLATKLGWKVYYLTTSDMAKCRQGELLWKVIDWLTPDSATTGRTMNGGE